MNCVLLKKSLKIMFSIFPKLSLAIGLMVSENHGMEKEDPFLDLSNQGSHSESVITDHATLAICPEMKVMIFSFIQNPLDIKNCMLVCKDFNDEFKNKAIQSIDIYNICFQSLSPLFIKHIVNLPSVINVARESMGNGTFIDISNQQIVFKDKNGKNFKVSGGKLCNHPIYQYRMVGNQDSFFDELKDADLSDIKSYHKLNGGGCSLRSVGELMQQGWILIFNDNEYNLFFNQFEPK